MLVNSGYYRYYSKLTFSPEVRFVMVRWKQVNAWKLIGALGLALTLGVYQSCDQTSSSSQSQQAAPSQAETATTADSDAKENATDSHETLDDRLEADDGFAAVVFYASDITGSLDVCGCAANPLGGLARRQGYINAFETRRPNIPYLHVDLGHCFSERTKFGTTSLLEPVKVGNDWVVRAYDAMNVSAVNVSFRDLLQLKHLWAADVYPKERQQYPVLDRFISANVRAKSSAFVAPRPYLIQTLRGRRLKRPLKMALVGLTEAGTLPQENFTIEDPLQMAERVIPEVRAKSDLVVVLGYLNRPTAQRLATSGLGIDALLIAYRYFDVQPVRRFGKTLMATSIYEGRLLGELRIYVDEQGRVSKLSTRYVSLDRVVPDDPNLASFRDEAREAMKAAEAP